LCHFEETKKKVRQSTRRSDIYKIESGKDQERPTASVDERCVDVARERNVAKTLKKEKEQAGGVMGNKPGRKGRGTTAIASLCKRLGVTGQIRVEARRTANGKSWSSDRGTHVTARLELITKKEDRSWRS